MNQLDVKIINAIEKFQCTGCTSGSNVKCGVFEKQDYGTGCEKHSAGTFVLGQGKIALGLPNGFNKIGKLPKGETTNIRIFDKSSLPTFDVFNLPTWYFEYEGYLLVRTYLPRIDRSYIDIIIDGKKDDINVDFSGGNIENFDSKGEAYNSVNVSLFQELID